MRTKIKDKTKERIYLIMLIFIILFGILGICTTKVFGEIVVDKSKAELFIDDVKMLNWAEVPVHLFDAYGMSLWCSEHNKDFDGWILDDGQERDQAANQAHYEAWKNDIVHNEIYITAEEQTSVNIKEDQPYKYYGCRVENGKGISQGLIGDHRSTWASAFGQAENASCKECGGAIKLLDPYDGDQDGYTEGWDPIYDVEKDIIKSLNLNAPGLGMMGPKPKMRSIELNEKERLYARDHQAAAYIYTAQKLYSAVDMPMSGGNLTAEEKRLGYFDVDEKQWALWSTDINIGAYSIGNDRNLGKIALEYEKFYNNLRGSANGYKDLLDAYPATSDSNRVEDGEQRSNRVEERTHENLDKNNTDPELDDLKMYVFKDTVFQTDTEKEKYLIGPYTVDYTYNDETFDEYSSLSSGEKNIKLNAIEKMTVYNQNGDDIESLGASFRVVYEDGGESVKTRHISDQYYYDKADYAEVDGFESRKPFYIEVTRGTMEPEDFTGFYIQVDFQYLDEVTAEAGFTKYEAKIVDYWYERVPAQKAERTYDVEYWEPNIEVNTYTDDDGNEKTEYIHHCTKTVGAFGGKVGTIAYELHREYSSDTAQEMIAYYHDGWRHYKRASLIITSEWEPEGQPGIKLKKVDAETGDTLYGAQFGVSVEIQPGAKNIHYQYDIAKRVDFFRITDTDGYITIPASELEAYDMYLGTLNGDVKVTFQELVPPAGYVINPNVYEMTLTLKRGIIQSVSGDAELDKEKNEVTIEVENKKEGEPIIQIAKVTEIGKNIGNKDPKKALETQIVEEAYFDIHVSYTENAVYDKEKEKFTNNGTLIDKKSNIIRGQTEDGYLNLTVEDFANMKKGFNIKGYTGKVTLHIVEVRVKGGYSIQSDGLSVTLEYVDGYLVNYSENTDDEVLVHYLYDDPLANICKWAKGEGELYPYIQETLDKWVKDQLKAHDDMKYDDVLAALVKYIEEGKVEIGSELEEWKASTISLEDSVKDKNIVQIVVEDFPGLDIEIPDIPVPKPNPTLMKVGGIVFLDQDTTKESENESNGKLDVGEDLLSGIEVTLYEVSGEKAKLVQKEGEVRTNPTITNTSGYYEFRGVDPLKEYYVEFKYNGMEYKNTVSKKTKYNSEEWAVSSKGAELAEDRSKLDIYKEIKPDTVAFDYYEIEGIYAEATRIALSKIANNESPDMKAIREEIKANHPEDPEIGAKIDYINTIEVRAKAGYSSEEPDGTYPYYKGDKFLQNNDAENEGEYDREYAGSDSKLLYPGQLQIHLGLVERPSTDLELVTDIVKTHTELKRYETTQDYHESSSSYHQYLHPEDYNYATNPEDHQGDGIAYYTEDNMHFYITYEITAKNASLTKTKIEEIVDYYNSEFRWQDKYVTPKGNEIKGIQVWKNGQEMQGASVSDSGYINSAKTGRNFTYIADGTINSNNSNKGTYKAKYINFGDSMELVDGDDLVIHLTFELVGDTQGDEANAKEVLTKYLCPPQNDTEYSRSWAIANFAEINAYKTEEAVLDVDSRPGNLVIEDFDNALKVYQETYKEYKKNPDEEHALAVKLALTRLKNVREDDSWKVNITLTNSGYIRRILGNVWEAVDEETPNSVHLQSEYGKDKYLEYKEDSNLALEGIKVELVELLRDEDAVNGSNQIVRAVTQTDSEGKYEFKSYLPGNYTVRFIYGDYSNVDETLHSKVSSINYEDKDSAYKLPINGQYYQSTKANPESDVTQYWYKERDYDKDGITEIEVTDIKNPHTRYSDAYDDAYSRLTQMNSTIENAENSTSTEYDYDGVIEIETARHTDPIYAYTSTMELEVEYIRPQVTGNQENACYAYTINNIDFGITPRAYNDVNIDKYVENIKVYTQKGQSTPSEEVTPFIDAYFNKDGTIDTSKSIIPAQAPITMQDHTAYKDGKLDVVFEEILQNGAQLEITYRVTVTNDSYYDKDKGVYDQITYIYNNGKKVGVKYYDEDTDKLVTYESEKSNGNGQLRQGSAIIYHNDTNAEYQDTGLKGEYRNQLNDWTNNRLKNYKVLNGCTDGPREMIKSKAVKIVDFPSQSLDFVKKDRKGNDINLDWEQKPEYDAYVSSREKYKYDGDGNLVYEAPNSLKQNTVIMAASNNKLLNELEPGQSTDNTITLFETMSTKTVDTSEGSNIDLTVFDDEYSNFIELSRLYNTAGKIVDLEGYDINGEEEAETSKIRNPEDIDEKPEPKFTPTLGSSKSETVVITDPAGLNIVDNVVGSNLGIVLIVLVVLAGGIILIKKYVLVPKN